MRNLRRILAVLIAALALVAGGSVLQGANASNHDTPPVENECADGQDNDGDGMVDGDDPDCEEPSVWDCSDGEDNDGDGKSDADDPGCKGPEDNSEFDRCTDGKDNDGDGKTDANDPDCQPGGGGEQVVKACADGKDNDGDGKTDAEDPGCTGPTDQSEKAACGDGLDNDRDGKTDHPADPGCTSPEDGSENSDPPAESCQDGIDNDRDGLTDGADPDCREGGDTPPDPCTAAAGDPGLTGSGTLAQGLYDNGLNQLPVVGDPNAGGAVSGGVYSGGNGQALEVVTDEAACLISLPLDNTL